MPEARDRDSREPRAARPRPFDPRVDELIGEKLSGRLRDGPVRDLNAMVRRGLFAAEMEILQGSSSVTFETGDRDCLLILTLAGSCTVRLDDSETHDLAPAEILIHDGIGHADVRLAEESRAAVIHITPR